MRKEIILLAALVSGVGVSRADFLPLDATETTKIEHVVDSTLPKYLQIGKVKIDTALIDREKAKLKLDFNENYGYIPDVEAFTKQLKKQVSAELGLKLDVTVSVGGRNVEEFFYGYDFGYKKRDRLPFVYEVNPSFKPSKGLAGKNIAIWQSHGYYFESKENRWEWQRARIFETVEDLYTQSYVLPFLMPMLENAGAYVMSPRERDFNTVEIIIDNDGGNATGRYQERGGDEQWTAGGKGFAYVRKTYEGFANPFKDGTYRKVKTSKGRRLSEVTWSARVPKAGTYAVYVSYASLPESTTDALYTVHTSAGERQFRVNQTMGGGTWVYLGHFPLKAGDNPIVSLSNASTKKNKVVTADAVKVGGGYGNIARQVPPMISDNVKSADAAMVTAAARKSSIISEPAVSGYPRFTEAARYWLQWAGVPDSVYSPSHGENDYTDDYKCRGLWVNYLAGGSDVLPEREGLGIPVDLAFAFHSDAGTTMNDSIIGSLGIYYSNNGDTYANGTKRMSSRMLTDMVLSNIVNDVRAKYDSHWTRRGMWDASYYEARVPEVPTMLLELLSHQNLADMRYGLDPTFRFTVSRAVYKGMVQFLYALNGKDDYVIQPLPVNSFAIEKSASHFYRLSWKPTVDELCDRADARGYLVYESVGDEAFRLIGETSRPEYTVAVTDNEIHNYRIVAKNEGGVSFPSETLSLCEAENSKGEVMIVNGFTRLSAPDSFVSGDIAGFNGMRDRGVPYMYDISYIGDMFEFRRPIPWSDDDSAGFGASRANYEDKAIAGNTFDYPFVHGRSIKAAGYSFVSASVAAVENGAVDLKKYNYVDLILGKQKETQLGRGEKPNRYKIFSPELQTALRGFCDGGGSVFVSGSYVATDVWDGLSKDEATQKFASDVLGYKWRVGQASIEGQAHVVDSYFPAFTGLRFSYHTTPSLNRYSMESPDGLIPADTEKGCPILRYTENNIPAGVATDFGNYRTCVIGIPFELIMGDDIRDSFMKQVLEFFEAKK